MTEQRNLADLFARIWRDFNTRMPDAQAAIESLSAKRDTASRAAVKLARVLSRSGLQALPDLQRWLEVPVDPSLSVDERALLVSREIDKWYGKVDWPPHRSPEHARAWGHFQKSCRFNLDPTLGQVLPRLPRSSAWAFREIDRPDVVAKLFNNLFVAPLSIKNPSRELELRFELVASGRNTPLSAPPIVGIAPIAEASADMQIACHQDGDRHWYDVHASDLSQRAASIVKVLCERGAHIIVFPESALHPDALVHVQQAIMQHGPRSKLRLVIAGTTRREHGRGPPSNECVIFNHRGVELGRQGKLHRANLDAVQRQSINLTVESLPADDPIFEYITPGETVSVYEMRSLGRFAVMIGEDIGRSTGVWLRRNIGAFDWLFTPVLNLSTNAHRWLRFKAAHVTADDGIARWVVANSLPPNLRADPADPHCGMGLCGALVNEEYRFNLRTADLKGPGPRYDLIEWTPQADSWKPLKLYN